MFDLIFVLMFILMFVLISVLVSVLVSADVGEERVHGDSDQHASGVPAHPVQPRALPQPQPVFQQRSLGPRLALSLRLLTGLSLSPTNTVPVPPSPHRCVPVPHKHCPSISSMSDSTGPLL